MQSVHRPKEQFAQFHLFLHPPIRLGAIIWDAGGIKAQSAKKVNNKQTSKLEIETQYKAESSQEQKPDTCLQVAHFDRRSGKNKNW